MKKLLLSLAVIIGVFLIFVSTREGKFNYSVTGEINAPVEKVFPYLSDLKLGSEWSPWEKVDPNMKKVSEGNKLTFDGNAEAGSGTLEIIKVVPNEMVELKLVMTKPFHAENKIIYHIVPAADGRSALTWSMSGDGGFLGKLINVFMDCEKMIKEQFTKGISNLKTIVEK